MQFEQVLARFISFFNEHNARFAVIGGVAMQTYGSARFTADLDMVVDLSMQRVLIDYAEAAGYETLHASEGYSNHLHPEKDLGRLDFVYVTGATAETLFGSVRMALLFDGKVPVPSPEMLIALKLQAMHNDSERLWGDLADIELLMRQPDVDLESIQRYFDRFGFATYFDELRKRL